MSTRRTRLTTISLALATTLVLAGCGGTRASETAVSSAKDVAPDPESVSKLDDDPDLIDDIGADAEPAIAAGCRIGRFDEQEPEHTEVGSIKRADWNSFPPTSGPHYENWAPFGIYDELVDDGFTIHNLEHGGVAVWYGDDVPASLVQRFDDQIDDGEKWLLMPRPELDGIASSSWTKLMHCSNEAIQKMDETETAKFVGAWFDTVQSTGSDAEKDVPAYTGGMESPKPIRDVSADTPSFG